MKKGPILITGGAGFIGSNIADSYLRDGRQVIILDALVRPGVDTNLDWLVSRYGKRVKRLIADIRDKDAVTSAVERAGAIIHLAAQVAVTTSLTSPLDDFSINGQGTLNVLEAVRKKADGTPIVFASTNKVYGHLAGVELGLNAARHVPQAAELRNNGIAETQPLDFATPYGCSKGVADQYVLDYSRTFGLRTAVLRMSCIYGPRQFGTEDQGWVAHFLIRAVRGKPITIYGDGCQVRDILHVRDAVAAYRRLLDKGTALSGHVYNLGGGAQNAVSLRTMLAEIEAIVGHPVDVEYANPRLGDQLYFVADTRRLRAELGWSASVGWREGLRELADWVTENRSVIHRVRGNEPERMIA